MIATPNGAENGSSSFPVTETVNGNGEQTMVIDTTIIGSGGSSDSSSLVVESAKLDDDDSLTKEDDVGINAVEFNDPPSMGLPKAVEGLHEMGPTPFLRKTYEIVDETITDPIVSWSSNQNSFIIWNPYEFSENLLPKYFKHNNFSSFIRQLNSYGFRKVDSDKWEFANEGFQKGNKDLLKNIKRRSKGNSNKNVSTPALETETETEIESLKKDQSSMRLEMLKLKQKQEESDHQMVTVKEKIKGVESKQQHMLSFFARLAKDQRLVKRLIRKRKFKQQREHAANEFVKKLKFLQDQETQEKLLEAENDLTVREEVNMAATQPNLEFDVMMNNESEITRCQLNKNDGSKTVVDVSGRDSKIYRELEDLIGEEWTD